MTKPLKLSLRNYSFLNDMDLELRRITVLTGDNGVGKREVVNAMTWLAGGTTPVWRDVYSPHSLVRTPKDETVISLGDCSATIRPDVGNMHYRIDYDPRGHGPVMDLARVFVKVSQGFPKKVVVQKDISFPRGTGPDTMFLCNYPESGLSERLQYEAGKELALYTQNGGRMFIVTHSSHVIMGIQSACINGVQAGLSADDAVVCFMARDDDGTDSVMLPFDRHGTFSDYPTGFMDQTTKELMENFRWGK